MSLQLTDLNEDIKYIQVDASRVPYAFSIKLDDRTYTFTVKYNDAGGFYTVDLTGAGGEVLAFGEIIRYGRPLFNVSEDERFPIPVIIPLCISGDGVAEVTRQNLGKEVKLYIFERRTG